jgi:hypothetical protein
VLTASLVVSPVEAYLAFSEERRSLGPNGEPRIARILHTRDQGVTWREVPWVRSLMSRIRHPGYPTWPPELVIGMRMREGLLRIIHRDEWVPYEPGGESLWESTLDDGEWHLLRIRLIDYETSGAPTHPYRIGRRVPTGFQSPPAR